MLTVNLVAILLCILTGAAITYVAIYKIKPKSFKATASIMRFAAFSVEINSFSAVKSTMLESEQPPTVKATDLG
jgi:hypothetical protein